MHRESRVVGLIGHPLGHSLSPVFQQAAFDFHRLALRYELWPTPATELLDVLARIRRADCLGANVTIPHKVAVLAHLDEVDRTAAEIGAVNTIHNQGGRLKGYNTDASGFARALDEARFAVRNCRALVVGAGGAARAVALALAWQECARLTIAARRVDAARDLKRSIAASGRIEVRVCAIDEVCGDEDLIVNCTSVGMKGGTAPDASPLADHQIPSGALVYDLVYNPPITPLLRIARSRGARVLGGLPMLVHQGAAAFTIWTNLPAPVPLMLARAEETLTA